MQDERKRGRHVYPGDDPLGENEHLSNSHQETLNRYRGNERMNEGSLAVV
jgi:hypothetical protein